MSFGARRCTALAALARLPIETHAPVKKQGSVRERKYVPLPCHGSIKPSCSGKKYVVVAMRHGIPAHPHGSRSKGPSLCNKGRGVSQPLVSPHWVLSKLKPPTFGVRFPSTDAPKCFPMRPKHGKGRIIRGSTTWSQVRDLQFI